MQTVQRRKMIVNLAEIKETEEEKLLSSEPFCDLPQSPL